ncbi:MAG: pilus assembly protein PilM [Bacilli bacterium]|nr:pilus assembly protein PilM [Bacilli bacterium]
MKNNTIALEISHKYIKVAFGYVQDGQVFINFVKKAPINHFLENGIIKEKNALVKDLMRMNPIVDQEYQFDELINNVTLVLPPYGLEVYQTKQITSVISPEKVIGELDIKNIYSIIRNKRLPVDNELIDIVPEAFVIDNGNMYAHAPIGKTSSAITAFTKVLTLPKRINQEYSEVVKNANIQINRKVVSTFAASELIASYPDTPDNFFLVDIGAASTSVSLVGNKQLFATRSFSWGGDNITDHLVSKFNISETEAEKIKVLYGLDKRVIKFDYSVCSVETEEGVTKHYVGELNSVIEEELDELIRNMTNAIEQLAQAYNVIEYANMPIILIGGGSKLKGIVPYILSKETFQNVKTLSPTTIGARDPSLFALLGAIYSDNKYPNASDEEKKQSSPVSREE